MSNYFPLPPQPTIGEAGTYAYGEFQDIAKALSEAVPFVQLQQLDVEPAKPRAGMIVLADGTHWNPGSGAGYYGYRGGAWHALG